MLHSIMNKQKYSPLAAAVSKVWFNSSLGGPVAAKNIEMHPKFYLIWKYGKHMLAAYLIDMTNILTAMLNKSQFSTRNAKDL